VLTHKAAQLYPPIPLIFQLLIVPVTDNTASASGVPHVSWRENEHTPWLTPERMLWFRRQYLPQEPTRARWDASPLLAQDEMFHRVPKAWIAVAELDILRDEGIAYGKKLLMAGVPTEIRTYKGAPHPIMSMDGTYPLANDNHSLYTQRFHRPTFRVSRCSSCGGVQAYSFAQRAGNRKAIGLRRGGCTVPGVSNGMTSVMRSADRRHVL
jgi:acetyl esterase/lipase